MWSKKDFMEKKNNKQWIFLQKIRKNFFLLVLKNRTPLTVKMTDPCPCWRFNMKIGSSFGVVNSNLKILRLYIYCVLQGTDNYVCISFSTF